MSVFRAFIFCSFLTSLYAGGVNSGSLFLYNDSPFILTATILASDGTYLGQSTVQPGQQANFSQNLYSTEYEHPGAPEVSLTPYTVIWQCPSRGHYSMCTGVSPGSFVSAGDCPGNHFCNPREKAKEETPASTLKKKK